MRKGRFALGVGMFAVAAGVLALMIVDARQRDDVVVLRRDVEAGAEVTADDLEVVELAVDGGLSFVGSPGEVVGQYARYRMLAGAMLTPTAVQPRPLVRDGHVLMAVPISVGELPGGLAVGDEVLVVVAPPAACPADGPAVVDAYVAAPPPAIDDELRTRVQSGSLSIEVPSDGVVTIATGEAFAVARPNTQPLPEPPPIDTIDCAPDAIEPAAGGVGAGGPDSTVAEQAVSSIPQVVAPDH